MRGTRSKEVGGFIKDDWVQFRRGINNAGFVIGMNGEDFYIPGVVGIVIGFKTRNETEGIRLKTKYGEVWTIPYYLEFH